MKNLFKFLPFVILIFCVGLGCKDSLKLASGGKCRIEGEPDPKTSEDYYRRANMHREKNNFAEEFIPCAYEDLDQAVKLDGKNAPAYAHRGLMLLYDNRMAEAKADFDKAAEADPDYSTTYLFRSAWHKKNGDLDSAIADMGKTIELAPAESDYDLRAQLYELKKDYENAAKDYTSAIALKNDGVSWRNSEEFYYYQLRAAAYRKLGKEDLAIQDDEAVAMLNKRYGGVVTGDSRTKAAGVLNDKALELPKPPYPPTARAVRAAGTVVVNIEVDTAGNVTKAEAESGHPLLKAAAVAAARQAKFKPGPSPVSGSLEYEFSAQ